MKQKETDYLLKYVTNNTYKKVLEKNNTYTIESLIDNRIDVDLNIRYLIKIGIKNIDRIVLERLDDLLLKNNEFESMINQYVENLTKDGLIDMLENI